MEKVLEVKNLNKSFDSFRVCKNFCVNGVPLA
jgi:hypothetical protein